ncbi:MAG: Hpt domain-containing protein, partial [Chthoniobacterales bacterium]
MSELTRFGWTVVDFDFTGTPWIIRVTRMTALVDFDQLDMIADGYTEDFVEIYHDFEQDLPRILGEVQAGIDATDPVATSRMAHQAKGSAANFGFIAFTTLMAEIESLARDQGSVTGAGELLD